MIWKLDTGKIAEVAFFGSRPKYLQYHLPLQRQTSAGAYKIGQVDLLSSTTLQRGQNTLDGRQEHLQDK
jgi:hypothetical protein